MSTATMTEGKNTSVLGSDTMLVYRVGRAIKVHSDRVLTQIMSNIQGL